MPFAHCQPHFSISTHIAQSIESMGLWSTVNGPPPEAPAPNQRLLRTWESAIPATACGSFRRRAPAQQTS